QPPSGKTQEPAGEEREQKRSERLRKNRPRHVFGIDGSMIRTNGGQRGEGAKNQEHHSTRRVADPRHPFEYRSRAHVLPFAMRAFHLNGMTPRPFRYGVPPAHP